jgi:hypothetical protein
MVDLSVGMHQARAGLDLPRASFFHWHVTLFDKAQHGDLLQQQRQ